MRAHVTCSTHLAGCLWCCSALCHSHPILPSPSTPLPMQVRPVEMPGLGSVSGFSGSHKYTEIFFTFTGFTEPVGGFVGEAVQAGRNRGRLVCPTGVTGRLLKATMAIPGCNLLC